MVPSECYDSISVITVANHLKLQSINRTSHFLASIFPGITCTHDEWKAFLSTTLTGALAAPEDLFKKVIKILLIFNDDGGKSYLVNSNKVKFNFF